MVTDLVNSKVKYFPTYCLVKLVLFFILKKVKNKIGVDLKDIDVIKNINKIKIPTFFMVGKEDVISRPD